MIEERKKYNILIVDDIPDNLKILSNILHQKGMEISFALNGMQALETVIENPPDLVLLDISMPGMDGFQVCQKLKENKKTKHIPIIFLTARNQTADVEKGFKMGGVDYITKPYNSTELMSRVFTHLELKASRDLIEKQLAELKELNATKDKFFSIVAHDLKNPFTTVMGFSDLLVTKSANFNEDTKNKYYKYIYNSARNGYVLLENLLKWAQLQTRQIKVNKAKYSIKQTIDEVVGFSMPTAEKKNINLKTEYGHNTDMIFFDKDMISTVIRNLLSNSIKFTPLGGAVKIITKSNNEKTTIAVKDTGIGISDENIQKLFRIDEQLSTPGTEMEKGNGLGLILCKDFVEQNNGSIQIESKLNSGTTISFTLNNNNDVQN